MAKFRTKFAESLKDLFKQIGHVAMSMGLIRLGEVAFDGTRVKANNSRSRCHTAKTLEEKLQALDQLFEEMLAGAEAADAAEACQPTSDGDDDNSPTAVNQPQKNHPAKRDDPREPIPTQQWPDLPRNKAGRLYNSCFVYDAKEDQYYCPQGKPLPFVRVKSATRRGLSKTWRIYRCKSCKDWSVVPAPW